MRHPTFPFVITRAAATAQQLHRDRHDCIKGNIMDGSELQQIEQRITEGYYDADADALCVMRRLVDEVRRFREEVWAPSAELVN